MNFTPDKNINIEINPSYITKENFRLSIDERIPKLIFKDDKYKKFSYQGIKYDEKELKRRFKGQSYISIPFIILTDNNGVVIPCKAARCIQAEKPPADTERAANRRPPNRRLPQNS